MIQRYDLVGGYYLYMDKMEDGDFVLHKDYLADIERAVDKTILMIHKRPLCPDFPCREMLCEGCIKTRIMEDLKK